MPLAARDLAFPGLLLVPRIDASEDVIDRGLSQQHAYLRRAHMALCIVTGLRGSWTSQQSVLKGAPCGEQHLDQEVPVDMAPQKLGCLFALPVAMGKALQTERLEAAAIVLMDSVGQKLGQDTEGRWCYSAPARVSREGWSASGLGPSGDLSTHLSGTRAGLTPGLVSVGTVGQSAHAAYLCGLG